jgi:DNA replication initiation complex subunit (GINS family)
LQRIDPNFFADTISYIKDKKKLLEAKSDSVFAPEERRKTERQLENIYKIIKELYERREKKIIQMAMDRSRTKSSLIDTSVMLKEEKVMFDAVTALLDNYREAILFSVLNEKMPFMQGMENLRLSPLKQHQHDMTAASDRKAEEKKSTKLVRFVSQVPKFVGPELEEYGPFSEEDIANLPTEMAEVLIGKGKAEEIVEE